MQVRLSLRRVALGGAREIADKPRLAHDIGVHAGFGERVGETDQPKGCHRAPA